ncbi:MAG: ABC transporter ATP-binding protein [Caldilineales bacterium]|nr:ABC transporter ATP-binding protein [Caldilineales bacterium]MCW5860717.1 ABC transporter ATP-binding protein [Caldilineales bacterium]
MTPALQAINVTKTYGDGADAVHAVDGVSLSVEAGEFIALVGPSGSGKTSMLAMLAGLLKPSSGSIRIDGKELAGMKEKDRATFRRQNIGFTFQANNLVPYLTAQDNVDLMLRLNDKPLKNGVVKSQALLTRLGLGDRLGHFPSELSGGQQQRVAIARALIHEPSVVLADEPTASLDTNMAHQVVQTFADLIHEQQRAGVMVTHDLRMCKYVDRVVMMKDGKIHRILSDRAEIDALAEASTL